MAHDATNVGAASFPPRTQIRADQGLIDEGRLPYLLFPRNRTNGFVQEEILAFRGSLLFFARKRSQCPRVLLKGPGTRLTLDALACPARFDQFRIRESSKGEKPSPQSRLWAQFLCSQLLMDSKLRRHVSSARALEMRSI